MEYNNFNNQQNQQQNFNQGNPPYYAGQIQYTTDFMQENPKKKHKGLKIFGIIAGMLACMILGSILTIGIALPIIRGASDGNAGNSDGDGLFPEIHKSKVPSIIEDQCKPDPGIREIGGAAPVIISEINPVPEIAEYAEKSVVRVVGYKGTGDSATPLSIGTAFCVHENGYLVTNYHVLQDCDSFKINITGEQGFIDAKYVGGDATNDLAVLKIDYNGMLPMAIGSSSECRPGEMVIAIGNPQGANTNLQGTVTVGYISCVSRYVLQDNVSQEYIQTDTAINPGNSGGPLFNSKGEVIGIVNLKDLVSSYDSDGTPINAEGLGFAIPIDRVKDTVLEIIQSGSKVRPGIGMIYSAVEAVADRPAGLLVSGFMLESPAEKAGIRLGDIVTEINGEAVADTSTLAKHMNGISVGDSLDITVYRDGESLTFKVIIGNLNHMVHLE